MIKKIVVISAAFFVALCSFERVCTAGSNVAKQYCKSPERYYHRLKNLRRNNPNDPQASYQIANLYYSLNMTDEAIKEYKRTLKLSSEHQEAKWFLAKLLAQKNYFEEAFWLVRSLIEKHASTPQLYLAAAKLLDKMGETNAAKEYYNKYDELQYGEQDGSQPPKVYSLPIYRGPIKQ